ncbi:Nuclear Envelope Morphology [Scheffersomyces stipitis CBS 6054]|uniref:Nuclear Envelope Morphology n=1 Tax=Scheffersomyces stipitis (strain ATCC 58785 / CBS 6054 / NBRC 10063 / NRRL Y-11545) TaxID=322104 RepID=A3GGD6_PICST|nr:Nuclear Envelope Morphology [Scheffersomyces stipitis CBS 6054]EAZ63502.1 Nuclear Envelope Morphology [Scheffersomyces stipitis CBS 6054]
MNSLKIIVNSFDTLYPKKDYELTSSAQDLDEEDDIDDAGEINLAKADIAEPNESTTSINSNSSEQDSILRSIANLLRFAIKTILFVPNVLIVKPISFMWLLVTFPFIYTFEQLGLVNFGNKLRRNNNNISSGKIMTSSSSTPDQRSEIDDKTEILKQENILSNNIKSPTSYSKYIIPPPLRLYPLSRNPQKKRKRKTLILDLDETLIHSLSRGSPRSFNTSSSSAPKMIEIKLNNIASLYYVHKRPYCDYFLKEISKWFELQIFTASVKEYADPIIDWLESDIIDNSRKNSKHESDSEVPSKIFTRRYYRTDCTYRQGVGYIKDLSKFFAKDDELKNVIILDNSPISYALHEDNAVMIEGWINDQRDRDLLHLLPMLHSLSLCIDVRYILGLRHGEKSFER